MNIQEYISSGVIESHVLGLTSKAEIAELDRLCKQYPEVSQALREAEEAMASYSLAHRAAPPEASKATIFNALVTEGLIQPAQDTQPVAAPPALPGTTLPPKKSHSFVRFIAIAASILFVATISFHLFKVGDYQRQIETLKREKSDLIAQNKTFLAQMQRVRHELTVLGDPAFQAVVLSGVPRHDDSRALVYWNTTSNELYLKPDHLPPLPAGKQYQLWGIVDGQPVSAGVYAVNDEAQLLQQMVPFAKAEMFAITIEKEGGSEQPTLDQMVVAGKT